MFDHRVIDPTKPGVDAIFRLNSIPTRLLGWLASVSTDQRVLYRSAPIIRAWVIGGMLHAAARRGAGRALIPRPLEAKVGPGC